MWIKSYDRMFDEFLVQPAFESAAEIFGNIPGTPNIYRETYKHILKIWKDSYIRQYKPYIESMFKLSAKIAEISKGGANLTEYKEFHNLWMNMYHDSFGKLIDENSIGTSKEVFEHFLHSTTVYLNMYKSWITALEKMSEKGIELSNSTGPEAYREFCDLWIKTYQKAFESFFEDMPMIGPMKETMEPVKVAARTYSNMLVEMSNIWKDSTFNPAGRN
jgi:hypothetical protein